MKKEVLNEFKKWLKEENLSIINLNADKNVAIYIRVSTNKQEELSPISQLKTIYKYAMTHDMQINFKYIFIEEEGISGKSAEKRKEFISMIGYAKQKEHPFDTIVVWKFSRFARNQEESIVYKNLLKKNNVFVISASEDVSESTLGPFATLIERVIEWMDEYYIIRLSGEVKRGMTEAANEGKYQSVAPFGYKWVGNKKNRRLVIVEEESQIIKMIFDKYIKDEMTMMELARYINFLGFKTKRGGKFENRTINYILLNPVYIGYTRWTPDGKLSRDEMYDNTKSIIKKGTHTPIIDEETFNLAKRKINEYRKYRKPHQIDCSNPWSWIKGLIRCNCGKTFIRSNKKLRCNGYNKGTCNISDTLNINDVKELILGEIKQYINIPIDIKDEKISTIKENIERDLILTRLKNIDKRKIRIKDAYINGIDGIDEYKLNKLIIEREKLELKEILSKIEETKKEDSKIIIENFKTVYNVLTDDNIDEKKKYDIAHEIINKVEYSNGELSLIFNSN